MGYWGAAHPTGFEPVLHARRRFQSVVFGAGIPGLMAVGGRPQGERGRATRRYERRLRGGSAIGVAAAASRRVLMRRRPRQATVARPRRRVAGAGTGPLRYMPAAGKPRRPGPGCAISRFLAAARRRAGRRRALLAGDDSSAENLPGSSELPGTRSVRREAWTTTTRNPLLSFLLLALFLSAADASA